MIRTATGYSNNKKVISRINKIKEENELGVFLKNFQVNLLASDRNAFEWSSG